MKIVIDTSTFISLAKINYPQIILNIKGTLLIPHEVYEEAVMEGEKKDIPDATLIKRFVSDNNISIFKAKDTSFKDLFSRLKKTLPRGDTAVLALAIQEKADTVMIDDEGLTKIALSLGFNVVASPDLMLQSLKEGGIEFKKFEKNIKNLVLENRVSSVVGELYIMEGKKYVKN